MFVLLLSKSQPLRKLIAQFTSAAPAEPEATELVKNADGLHCIFLKDIQSQSLP